MNLAKFLLVAAVAGGGAHLWQAHEHSVVRRQLSAAADSNGFVPILTSGDEMADTAVILAALNCPSAQAKRADAMARQLTQMGIPNRRANNYSLSRVTRDQMPLMSQTNAVLTGEIPIVIINGMAKANPTADEVAAEYRRGR